MSRSIIYSFLVALVSLGFMACDSDDNGKQTRVPEGAKPSTEFKLGDCEDEANAKDAIKLVVNNWGDQGDQDFASIELFADGHFLITTPKAGKLPKRAASATRSANIFKKHGDAPLKTRATDINGTIDLENGAYIYGTFTRVKEGVYSLRSYQ